jgi:transcriptional regulator with XRE-family HTH domain
MKIRDVRHKLNLTQEQMGELMGMPQSSISRIETGGHMETRQQIATLKLILSLINGEKK